MAITFDRLLFEESIRDGDREGLRSLLMNSTESERAALSDFALSSYRKRGNSRMQIGVHNHWAASEHDSGRNHFAVCLNACLVTTSFEELQKLDYSNMILADLDFDLLASLRPASLTQFGGLLINQDIHHYESIRALVKRNLCDVPTDDRYVLAIIASNEEFGWRLDDWRPVSARFAEEPDLRQNIWRIFEVESEHGTTLLPRKFSRRPMPETWIDSLVVLSQAGDLSRQRLLQASLEAMTKGFKPRHLLWFIELYDALKPSREEILSNLDSFGYVLASQNNQIAKWVLKELSAVSRKQPLPPEFHTKYLRPILLSESKSNVLTGLKLLEQTTKCHNEFAAECCSIAVDALLHKSPEIQNTVVELLRAHTAILDASIVSKIQELRQGTSAALAAKLSDLLGDREGPSRKIGCIYVQGDGSKYVPVFDDGTRVDEITTADELIAVSAYCIEHPNDSLQLERIMQGCSTMWISQYDSLVERFSPLKKRTAAVLNSNSFRFDILQCLVAMFIRNCFEAATSFKSGDEVEPESPSSIEHFSARVYDQEPPYQLVLERCNEIVIRLKSGVELPMLSFPSNEQGWIEPSSLIRRFEQYDLSDRSHGRIDEVIALLRLPLEHWAHYSSKSRPNREFWRAVNYASASSDAADSLDTPLWKAANTFRSPPEFGRLVDIGTGRIFGWMSSYSLTRWQALMFPSLRELLLGAGIGHVASSITGFDTTAREDRIYLELASDPNFPIRERASKLIATGLFVGDPEFAGCAGDAVIAAIDRGALDVNVFGDALCRLLYSEKSKPTRLSNMLHQVAQISDVHLNAVRRILERTLRGGVLMPKGLSSVLELFHELLIAEDAVVEDEATIAHLQSIETGAQTGKLIKAILKL
jgi:hypothetical protein